MSDIQVNQRYSAACFTRYLRTIQRMSRAVSLPKLANHYIRLIVIARYGWQHQRSAAWDILRPLGYLPYLQSIA